MAIRTTRSPRGLLAVASVAAAAIALSGCAGDEAADPDAPVTLKLSVFGDASVLQGFVDQYQDENPNVTVEVNVVASSEDARTNLLTKLAAGSGLADVEQLESAWVGQLYPYADKFVAFEDDGDGDWVTAQAEPVTLPDGKLFGYGIGLGPEAICYRADLFEAAGLPSDAESVAGPVGGSWEEYFDAGEQYVDAGGGAWYDSSYLIFLAQVEQLANPYETADGEIVVDNPEVEAIFKDTLARADRLSAKLSPFSEDWNAGMGSGAFATITCPSWLLSSIEGNSPGVDTWRIADAFPGGGGNIGGSYFAVPTQSANQEAAAALASWLTAPAQQVAAFAGGSAFPSRVDAFDDAELTTITDDYFDAPIGEIFANRSEAIDTVTYKGLYYIAIDTAAFNAMTRVEAGQQSIDDAWDQFVAESEAADD